MASRDKMWPMTTYTETKEGPIDHLKCRTAIGQPFLAPVKVRASGLPFVLPSPVRTDDGRLIYMLPGGKEVLA